jgi:hypothetical protein
MDVSSYELASLVLTGSLEIFARRRMWLGRRAWTL